MNHNFSDWTEIIIHKLNTWWVTLIANLPNILLATIVGVTFYFLAKFVKRFTYKIMPRLLGKHTINSLFSNVAYMIVLLLGMFISLNILNLNQAVTSLLAGAGIIGLVLGFAFQDLSANFISGIFIAFKRPFNVGDAIETNGYIGNIEDIQLRTSTIRTGQGLHLMIPNKDIFQKAITNYSKSDQRRIEIEFSMSPDHDLRKAKELCKQSVDVLDYIVKEKPVEVYYTGFGDNVIKVAVWFWIYNHKPPGFMVARHDAIVNIVERLAQNEITLIMPVTFTEQKKKAFEDLAEEKIIDNHQKASV
jgi:small conductance mechanosensitive channel